LEYREASELFRHIYTNIWQSGAIFIASAFVVVGFLLQSNRIETPYTLIPMALIAFWWLGIFEPLNHYGDWRSMRAAQIERVVAGLTRGPNNSTPKLFRVPLERLTETHDGRPWQPGWLHVRTAVRFFAFLLEVLLAVPIAKQLLVSIGCLCAP